MSKAFTAGIESGEDKYRTNNQLLPSTETNGYQPFCFTFLCLKLILFSFCALVADTVV